MKGRDIYFRRRGGPRPISRKWYFRGSTFPESNNTESSFNKGSATIYRGHASHSHLSASIAYIAISPSRRFYRPFFRNLPAPSNPFRSGTIMCRDTLSFLFSRSLSRSLSLYDARRYVNIFFHYSFYTLSLSLSLSLSPPLSLSLSLRAHAIVSDYGCVALRGRYFSTDSLHYFNERDPIACCDPFRSHASPPKMTRRNDNA